MTDVETIREIAREFTEGFNTGDVDRLMRYYGSSYVDVNLRRPVQTRAERQEYFMRVIGRGGFRIAVHPDDVVVEGDLAWVRGHIEIVREGAPPGELRYLEILRRTPDGWQVVYGMDGPVQENE
jgi:ketosteroid isomerase-like protein